MAKVATDFLRIVQKLEKIRYEHRRSSEYRGITRGLVRLSEEGTYKEIEEFRRRVRTIEQHDSILGICLDCYVKGSYEFVVYLTGRESHLDDPEIKITGFWKDLLVMFVEEGLDSEAFLEDVRKRLTQKNMSDCTALQSSWLLQWIAERL